MWSSLLGASRALNISQLVTGAKCPPWCPTPSGYAACSGGPPAAPMARRAGRPLTALARRAAASAPSRIRALTPV